VDDDNTALGFVFVGIFIAFVLSGLAPVVVGEVIRRRGAGRGAWLMIGTGVAVLLISATAVTFPTLLG
jgi:preprotein translocase subunit SecY